MPRLTSHPPRVNPALIAFAHHVRNLDKMPRRQCVRRAAEILPGVLLWIAGQLERRRRQ